MLGPRWTDSRAEGGIVPNREMEGARRRTASGEGGKARRGVVWGNRTRLYVLVMPNQYLKALPLSRHISHLIWLYLVPWEPNKYRETARFRENEINIAELNIFIREAAVVYYNEFSAPNCAVAEGQLTAYHILCTKQCES